MKKLILYLLCSILILGFSGFAHAIPVENLLQNGSFEEWNGTDFEYWTEGGEWYRDSRPYEGTYSARLGVQSGNLYQPFTVTSGETLYFGAYFRFITNNTEGGNWDQAQINMQIAGLPDTTIGGSISNFQGLSWDLVGGTTYISNWMLLSGMVDITGASLPANSAINISLQDFNPANSRVLVDNAYAGVTPVAVPEPASILLLGAGFLGILAARRKRFKNAE